MNWEQSMKEQLETKWEQMKGRVKDVWSDLTDQDIEKMQGSWDAAVAYLQEKYGQTKEQIEEKLNSWTNKE